MTNSSAGAGRDGKLREQIAQRLQDVASFNGCIGNNRGVTCVEAAPTDPTFWCKYCVQGHAAVLLAVPDPLASETGPGLTFEQSLERAVNAPKLDTKDPAAVKAWAERAAQSFIDAEEADPLDGKPCHSAPLASSSAPQGEKSKT